MLKAICIMAHLLQQGIIIALHLPNLKLYLQIKYILSPLLSAPWESDCAPADGFKRCEPNINLYRRMLILSLSDKLATGAGVEQLSQPSPWK